MTPEQRAFLDEYKALCLKHGMAVSACDCGGAVVVGATPEDIDVDIAHCEMQAEAEADQADQAGEVH